MIASASRHDHEPQNFYNLSNRIVYTLAEIVASATESTRSGSNETRHAAMIGATRRSRAVLNSFKPALDSSMIKAEA
jgi:hypothetical protein